MKIGEKVKIAIPDGELTAGCNILQFNGIKAVVKSVKRNIKYGKCEIALEECHSPFNHDYIFLEEWLIPLEV